MMMILVLRVDIFRTTFLGGFYISPANSLYGMSKVYVFCVNLDIFCQTISEYGHPLGVVLVKV